jgi:outer membrane lipoprotein carrier protein
VSLPSRMFAAMSLLAVPAAFVLQPAPAHAQSGDGTIGRAVSAWSKVKTARATFEQTVTNSLTGSTATARGDYQQQRPGKLSIRFTGPDSGRIVADGKAVWVYLPSSTPGQVIKRAATDDSAMPVDFTGQFLDAPREKFDIADAGRETVSGRETHVLTLVPKPGTEGQVSFTRAKVWVDDRDALIRQFETVEPSGVTRRVRIISLDLNVPVDRGAFVFTPPRGTRIVDQTK